MKTLIILFAIALCLCNSQGVPGGYTPVPNDTIQNSTLLQSLAEYGANATVQYVNSTGNLPNSDTNFTIASINSVSQQVVNGINYQFNVTLRNQNNGILLNAFYVINYQPTTEARRIASISYNIPPYAPIANSGSNVPGGYVQVPADQVQNSSIIQNLASIGAQNVIQQVIASGRSPSANTNFTISNINSVFQQVVNGLNYRFNVTLANSDGVQVNAIYTINYQAATNTSSVLSSRYTIATYPLNVTPIVNTTPAVISNASIPANTTVGVVNVTNATNNDTIAVPTPAPTTVVAPEPSPAPIAVPTPAPTPVVAFEPSPAPIPVPTPAPVNISTNTTSQAPAPTPAPASNVTVVGGFSQLPNVTDQNSSLIQSLAEYGAGVVVQAANNAGNLPNSDTNFTIVSINSVSQQVVNGINYLFNVTLRNGNNGIILNAIYTVNYQPTTQAQRLVSANYNIPPHAPIPSSGANNGTNLPGGYSQVPADQVQNSSVIQNLASIGAQNIIQQVVASGRLPTSNTNFSIFSINSVYQQVVNGLNYRFNVILTNPDGVQVSGIYTINYQAASNAASITSTSYVIAPYIQQVNVPLPAPGNATVIVANANNDSSSSSINTSIASVVSTPQSTVTVGGYTPLPASDFQNSTLINRLAALGAQNVTQQAIADGNVPSNSVFTVTTINSVAAQVVNGINYNINVVLNNADNSTTILADYIVYNQAWTNTTRVTASAYVVVPK